MFPDYELTEGAGDYVTVTCPVCGCEFELLRMQFEVDLEEEGEGWKPLCAFCQGLAEFFGVENNRMLYD